MLISQISSWSLMMKNSSISISVIRSDQHFISIDRIRSVLVLVLVLSSWSISTMTLLSERRFGVDSSQWVIRLRVHQQRLDTTTGYAFEFFQLSICAYIIDYCFLSMEFPLWYDRWIISLHRSWELVEVSSIAFPIVGWTVARERSTKWKSPHRHSNANRKARRVHHVLSTYRNCLLNLK